MFNENDFFNEGFVPSDPEKHELVKKLAALITDDIQVHSPKDITTDMPDYWLLDHLLTKEQVKFMLSFKKKRTVKLVPEEQVKAEAARCLGCGASYVDTNRCIGCGLCTTRCEFDAIHLSRDIPENSRMYTAEDGKIKAILPNIVKRGIKILKNNKK